MRMKTLRKLRTLAPRVVTARRRGELDVSDATIEPDAGPAPEAVFDRVTGPYGRRHAPAHGFGGPGGFDEET